MGLFRRKTEKGQVDYSRYNAVFKVDIPMFLPAKEVKMIDTGEILFAGGTFIAGSVEKGRFLMNDKVSLITGTGDKVCEFPIDGIEMFKKGLEVLEEHDCGYLITRGTDQSLFKKGYLIVK